MVRRLLLVVPRTLRLAFPLAALRTAAPWSGGSPPAETRADRDLRTLWEGRPFRAAECVVESVLDPNAGGDAAPPLRRFPRGAEDEEESGGGSEADPLGGLFADLYGPRSGDGRTASRVPAGEDVPPTLREGGRRPRTRSFRLEVAYRGRDYCGWQAQPGHELPSVQRTIEDWLRPLLSEEQRNDGRRPDVRVAGRTDAGVSALRQVCRFRTWDAQVDEADVLRRMRDCPDRSLRCRDVARVGLDFHPTFLADCRAYAFLVDLQDGSPLSSSNVPALDGMLRRLEGRGLDYSGMSRGKIVSQTVDCNLRRARAFLVSGNGIGPAVCVELVGDRFLRRMARILVATALRETFDSGAARDADRLLDIVREKDRRLSARSAPPDGLCFVGAGFGKIFEQG